MDHFYFWLDDALLELRVHLLVHLMSDLSHVLFLLAYSGREHIQISLESRRRVQFLRQTIKSPFS